MIRYIVYNWLFQCVGIYICKSAVYHIRGKHWQGISLVNDHKFANFYSRLKFSLKLSLENTSTTLDIKNVHTPKALYTFLRSYQILIVL